MVLIEHEGGSIDETIHLNARAVSKKRFSFEFLVLMEGDGVFIDLAIHFNPRITRRMEFLVLSIQDYLCTIPSS